MSSEREIQQDMNQRVVDPTLHRSPADAIAAPAEKLAYVALLEPDAIAVVDVDPGSPSYGATIGQWDAPHQDAPDEFHHYGWNICSSALGANHHHTGVMERRYLVVPGLRSSRIYILDTGEDPRHPKLVRTVEPAEVMGSVPNGTYLSEKPHFSSFPRRRESSVCRPSRSAEVAGSPLSRG